MSDLETFLGHLDARLEPIHSQLAKLADLQVLLVAVQERDRHQEEAITRMNTSIAEAFQVIRANNDATTAKHELSKERLEKLRGEFDVSSHKCSAVAVKFDNLNEDYKSKKLIIYGIAIALITLGGAFKWVATDYYTRFEAEMAEQRRYKQANETANAEREEQLKMITQQLRSMKK